MNDRMRRLAAVLVADVVGCSRMMAADEDGTLSALTAHRDAIDPVILNHGGRIVKSTGDGVLVEFTSAVAALEAAVGVQELMASRNAETADSRRMRFRIGINLGDVLGDATGDIFGAGVNVAARIESLADSGGICVTNAVYETVTTKTDLDFIDGGEQRLKNIPTRVRVWKLGAVVAGSGARPAPARRALATVAVLPFDTMSDEQDQEASVTWARESLQANRRYLQAHLVAAAACGQLGRPERAEPHVAAVLEMRPGFSSAKHRSRLLYDHESDIAHFVEGLVKADLPA